MARKSQEIQELDAKMKFFGSLQKELPSSGWIKSIRQALDMSMNQLGKKLGITKQSVQNIEKREVEGSITINALKEAAAALDMQLVYGFVPIDGSLEIMIERKARELATRIVMPTSKVLHQEDPANADVRIKKAIAEGTAIIKNEMPKAIWD